MYAAPLTRQANAGSFLSSLFSVWSKNFGTFFLVYLVVGLVTGGIGALLSYAVFRVVQTSGLTPIPGVSTISTTNLALLALYIISAVVAYVLITTIVAGAMAEFAVRRFRGEAIPVGNALRRGVQKFLSIFGANILFALIIVGIILLPLVLVIPLVLTGGSLGVVLALVIGFVVAIVIAVYVGLALLLFAPAIMMENATAVGGLRRSWAITKNHRLSLFGAVLVVAILAIVVSIVFSIVGGLFGIPVVALVVSAVSNAIISPWLVILTAVAYDLIVRPFVAAPGFPPPYPPQAAYPQPFGIAPPSTPSGPPPQAP